MNIKKKFTLLLIVCGIVLIGVFHLAFIMIVRPSLEDQKILFIKNFKEKIKSAMDMEEQSIAILSSNWSEWGSLARYLESPSAEFELNNFSSDIFDMIDLLIVANYQKDYLFARGYKDKKFFEMNQLHISEKIEEIKWEIKRKPNRITGIITSGIGPILIVAQPIITGEQLKRVTGVTVMGQCIDQQMIDKITTNVSDKVNTFSNDPSKIMDFYTNQMGAKDLHYVEQEDSLTLYYLIRDRDQKPAAIFYSSSDNKIFKIVNQHSRRFLLITFVCVILFGLLLYVAIETQIIRRITRISNTMKEIEGLEDLSKRISTDKKKDEIEYLVSNFNSMLDKLEQEKIKRENAEKAMIMNGKLASIGRLASSIGHEVNNPLLAISNSIQVIKKISKSKASLFHEAIEISESEISRIRELISSLLDFHRLGKEEFSLLDVSQVITKTLDVLRWSKKLGETSIVEELDKDAWILGSADKLKQVFINFVANAVEAMESLNRVEKGVLQIKVKKSATSNFIEVHFFDDGPGIPENIKATLFEPFVSTKGVKGVGLGLYISYKIIDTHHGEIIYDETYKEGTHFIIKLPKGKRNESD